MSRDVFTISLIFILSVTEHFCIEHSGPLNFTELYYEARSHYLDEQWNQTVHSFERLLTEWNDFQTKLSECRQYCASKPFSESIAEINLKNGHERFIQIAACQFNFRPAIICDPLVQQHIESNMPYNYLQLAYYKLNDLEEAASCAYTYFLKNLNDEVASSNVKHFQNMPGMRSSYFKARDVPLHSDIFHSAPDDYSDIRMEKKALLEKLRRGFAHIFRDLDDCFANCQNPISRNDEFEVDDGDLASNFGIHFSQYLNCTIFCDATVFTLDGDYNPDYILAYLLYLHAVATEVEDEEISRQTLSSISMLDLSEEDWRNLNLPIDVVKTFSETDSNPFPDFERFVLRKREMNVLTDSLDTFFSADDPF